MSQQACLMPEMMNESVKLWKAKSLLGIGPKCTVSAIQSLFYCSFGTSRFKSQDGWRWKAGDSFRVWSGLCRWLNFLVRARRSAVSLWNFLGPWAPAPKILTFRRAPMISKSPAFNPLGGPLRKITRRWSLIIYGRYLQLKESIRGWVGCRCCSGGQALKNPRVTNGTINEKNTMALKWKILWILSLKFLKWIWNFQTRKYIEGTFKSF